MGVRGKNESKLTTEKELYSGPHRAIVLAVTKPSIFVVSGTAPFGVKAKKDDHSKGFFLISSITPSGSIHKWNEENPDKLVSVGDVIMEISGVRCTASEVPKILTSAGPAVLDLTVLHYELR